jgi:Protein of unknown function (DUF1838)
MSSFKTIVAASLLGVLLLSSCATTPVSSSYDFSKPEDSLNAFIRLRGDASGADTIADWAVTVFIVEPGKRAMPVMRLDGFNVGRPVKNADGSYQWLSREVAYYRDLKTGKILDKWENPLTGKTNDVLHVINDPVNGKFAAATMSLPWNIRGDDVFLKMDIPLAYPNALQPDAFPEESTGPTYFASEHFLYFAKMSDFGNAKLTSVPSSYAWTRTGPWLPWMKMGMRPGYVLYTGQGKKLKSAVELDAVVREYTEKNYPEFMNAPKTLVTPNETSWTYYRKVRGGAKSSAAPAAGSGGAKAMEPAKK